MILVHQGNLTICGPGPTEVLVEEAQEPIWCFGCRKRHPGVHRLISEVGMSYYDPWWTYSCDGCSDDRRLFPGWCWL